MQSIAIIVKRNWNLCHKNFLRRTGQSFCALCRSKHPNLINQALDNFNKFTGAVGGFMVREFSSSTSDKPKPTTTPSILDSTHVQIRSDNGTKTQIGTRRPKQNLINRYTSPKTMTTNGTAGTRDTDDPIIWIDCEMTGLDIEKDVIMEVACIITGSKLEEIARVPGIVIHVPQEKLDSMVAWCVSHHGESGLTEDCKKSQVSTADAEQMLISFVQKHTRPGTCPLAGNSIYMDRIFLQKYMPTLYAHFHYRSIDVSTIKELTRRWFLKDYNVAGSRKRWTHRTIADIEDSINELKYYKSTVFKQE